MSLHCFSKKSLNTAGVLLLFLLSLTLRLYNLDIYKTFTWDEVALWYMSITDFRAPYMPPLPPWLVGNFFQLFGESSYIMHLCLAAISATTPVLLYLAAAKLLTKRFALLAGLLLAVSPLTVEYAREARHYGLVSLVAVFFLWQFNALSTQKKHSWRSYSLFFLASFLLLQVHLVFLQIFLAAGLAFLTKILLNKYQQKSSILEFKYLIVMIAAAVCGGAWILLRDNKQHLSEGAFQLGFGDFFVKTLFAFFGPAAYSVASYDLWVWGLIILLFVVTFFGLVRLFHHNLLTALFVIYAIASSFIVLYLTLGEKATWPWYRYLLHIQPMVYLATAAGLVSVYEKIKNSDLNSTITKLIFVLLILLAVQPMLLNYGKLYKANAYKENLFLHAAQQELEVLRKHIKAVILPQVNWGYGDESYRNQSLYFLTARHHLPVYTVLKQQFVPVELQESKLSGVKVPYQNISAAVKPEPGLYLLFPYGRLLADGPFGKNKARCNQVFDSSSGLQFSEVNPVKDRQTIVTICQLYTKS